jgi:hypothetical protein
MDTYTIDAGGVWGFYHPMNVPKGWRMLPLACGFHSAIRS